MHIAYTVIARFPRAIIGLTAIMTLVFGFHAQQVEMTTDIKDFFPADHPQVVTYDQIEEVFGGAEQIMVAYEAENVFTDEALHQIDSLTRGLLNLPGVRDVRSLSTVEEVVGSDWGIEVVPLVNNGLSGAEDLEVLRKRVLEDDLYAGTIVSVDGAAALTVVEVDVQADAVAVARSVHAIVQDMTGVGTFYVTGTPFLNAVLADSMQEDLLKLFPVVLLLVALILFLSFRTIRGVVLPFITVLISVIWTLGLMGMLGRQLSPLNAVMPVILVSLGNAYGIYILSRFNAEKEKGKDKAAAIKSALDSVGIAVLLAGLTTMAGFLSNVTSSITQMRDFGLFTAFGVLTALSVSLLFVPATLMVLPDVPRQSRARRQGVLSRCLDWLARAVIGSYRLVLAGTLAVVIVSALGVPRVASDSNFFNFFDEGSEPRVAYELVGERFSGSESLEVVVDADFQSPEVLTAVRAFQDDLEATGLVGTPTSAVNILERTNMALNDGEPAYRIVPDSRELAAQYFLLLEMSSDGFLDRFVTMDYGQGRIQALVSDSSPAGTAELFEAVDQLFSHHFAPLEIDAVQTGIIALLDTLASMLIQGQIRSLAFALFTVFIIVRLLLRSWEGSVVSTLLIATTALVNFGIMGWLGIPLDIVTVLISSIGIGVGVDYSIHVYSRYREEMKKGYSTETALRAAITQTGQAIATNAGAVVAGFLILVLSSFPPFRYFGTLVTAIMTAASLGSLTVIPALILLRSGRSHDSASKDVVHG